MDGTSFVDGMQKSIITLFLSAALPTWEGKGWGGGVFRFGYEYEIENKYDF